MTHIILGLFGSIAVLIFILQHASCASIKDSSDEEPERTITRFGRATWDFRNVSGNIENITSYLGDDRKPAAFEYHNIDGNVTNVQFGEADNNESPSTNNAHVDNEGNPNHENKNVDKDENSKPQNENVVSSLNPNPSSTYDDSEHSPSFGNTVNQQQPNVNAGNDPSDYGSKPLKAVLNDIKQSVLEAISKQQDIRLIDEREGSLKEIVFNSDGSTLITVEKLCDGFYCLPPALEPAKVSMQN